VGDTNYTLYSWSVFNAPGGNLTVDSAPTSATIGEKDTIGLSWSGATDGQWHLGAVSHNEGSTLRSRTLVDVNNR
jgi:hypothetical protein